MVAKSKKAKVSKKQPSVSSYLANVPENVLSLAHASTDSGREGMQAVSKCADDSRVPRRHQTRIRYDVEVSKEEETIGRERCENVECYWDKSLFARCGRYLTEIDLVKFPERLIPHVLELCATCPRLSKINFSGTASHSYGPAIVTLGNVLETLTEVVFVGAYFGSHNKLSDFFAKQRHWRFVDLCCSGGASTVLKHLTSIDSLSLSACRGLRQKDVLSLKDGCPNLKELDISYNEDIVRDSDLHFDGWPKLKALWFNECNGGYYHDHNGYFLTFSDMPTLKECHLRNSFVNDQMLRTLCVAAPNLVDLDLFSDSPSYHRSLTDYSLTSISNLRCLELLILNDTEDFTDQHVMSIALHGRLQYCDLAACRQISNNAIRYLLETSKDLTYLDVSNTSVDLEIAPDLLAYADEFEEDRTILQVVTANQQLENVLNAHPNINIEPLL